MPEIQEYDIKTQLPRDASLILVGQRRSGKTRTLRYVCHELRFKKAIAMVGSAEAEKWYEKFVLKSNVYAKFDTEKIMNILGYQRYLKRLKESIPSTQTEFAFLFDDLSYSPKFARSEALSCVVKNGRNYDCFVALCCQYGIDLGPGIRGNQDVVILFNEGSRNGRKKLFENYSTVFPDFQVFSDCMDRCTEDGGGMVIDRICKSNQLEDRIFHLPPPPPDDQLEPFVLGDEGAILFDKLHYRDDLADVIEEAVRQHQQEDKNTTPSTYHALRNEMAYKSSGDTLFKSLMASPLSCDLSSSSISAGKSSTVNSSSKHSIQAKLKSQSNNFKLVPKPPPPQTTTGAAKPKFEAELGLSLPTFVPQQYSSPYSYSYPGSYYTPATALSYNNYYPVSPAYYPVACYNYPPMNSSYTQPIYPTLIA